MADDVPVPSVSIKVNGTAMPAEAYADLLSVDVEEALDILSMFTLRLGNWDVEKQRASWSDGSVFAVGSEVTIALGYVGSTLDTVMLGEITGLEVVFGRDDPPQLLVRGYDHRHRLARGRRTATYAAMTDSTIATNIARAAGLRAEVHDSRVALDHVLQNNLSDWDFLRDRARRIGYEMFVQDKVMHFRPPPLGGEPVLTLQVGVTLSEFSARLSSMAQTPTTVVRGWDPVGKTAVRASATAPSTLMGGATPGTRQAGTAFGQAERVTVAAEASVSARAESMATGMVDARADTYVEGRAGCRGRARLRAGTVVEVTGVGTRFSGRYYVPRVTHTLDGHEGYRTTFDVRRTAV